MEDKKLWQVAEIKISYCNQLQLAEMPKITCSRDAEIIFRTNWGDDIELLEEFNALFLTKANRVKGLFRVSRGGLSGTVVDPKIIFATGLKSLACAIILGHNHPSGNVEPSQADVDITQKLRRAGEFLDLPILDHVILAPHTGYYSFSDEGRL